jgi:hypothetical protein
MKNSLLVVFFKGMLEKKLEVNPFGVVLVQGIPRNIPESVQKFVEFFWYFMELAHRKRVFTVEFLATNSSILEFC